MREDREVLYWLRPKVPKPAKRIFPSLSREYLKLNITEKNCFLKTFGGRRNPDNLHFSTHTVYLLAVPTITQSSLL